MAWLRQLTWDFNYKRQSQADERDRLVTDPDVALQRGSPLQVLFVGMSSAISWARIAHIYGRPRSLHARHS